MVATYYIMNQEEQNINEYNVEGYTSWIKTLIKHNEANLNEDLRYEIVDAPLLRLFWF